MPTLTPMPTPIPTPTPGKRFTLDCDQDIIKGHTGIERMTIGIEEDAHCVLRLTNMQPNVSVDISTMVRRGLRSSVKIEPISGITDANGELEFTITAIKNGIDWVAWAVPNEDDEIEFSRDAYENGSAWGMFVEVK